MIWVLVAIFLDTALALSYLSLATVQESGGDEGFWAVILFYPLIVVAPVVSVAAVWRLSRLWTGRPN